MIFITRDYCEYEDENRFTI